jgi:hypothetical protein
MQPNFERVGMNAPKNKLPSHRNDVAGSPSLLKALESVIPPAETSDSRGSKSKGLPEGMSAETAGRALASLFASDEPTIPGFPSPLAAAENTARAKQSERLKTAENELMSAQRELAKVRAASVSPATYTAHQEDVQRALENEHLTLETYNGLRREAAQDAAESKAGLTTEQRDARRADEAALRESAALFEARKKDRIEADATDARKAEEIRRALGADLDTSFKRTFDTRG